MSSMNFTCDVCGREVFSCTFVNGMKFCAKCYQETFGETDKDRKISDLEAQLAEEKEYTQQYRKECAKIQTDYYKTKQQLAEKDKEIESLKHVKVTIGTMETNQVDISSTTYIDQDKISFAIEQLEKVKEFVSRQLFITTKGCSDLDEAEAKGCNELREETIKEIDNQINELKGE